MVRLNLLRNPSFFHIDSEQLKEEMHSNKNPYLNTFGYENSNTAYALVCTNDGFANPFGGSTGPTGWVAPGLVFIYALSFYFFGCFSFGSILFMFCLAILLSLTMVLLIYSISLQLFANRYLAYLCSFLFAICPQDFWYLIGFHQQDFNIYSFLFLLNFFLFLQLVKSTALKNVILFSSVAGISVLFVPVMILPIGVCLAFFILEHRGHKADGLKHTGLCCAIIFLIIFPYSVYQKYHLGIWSFVKSNAAFELYLGNVKGYDGFLMMDLFRAKHPSSNHTEYQEYSTRGEVNYIQTRFADFLEDFNLLRYLKLTVKRFFYFLFIFKPDVPPHHFNLKVLVLHYVSYCIPGLSLLAYLLLTHKKMNRYDTLIYLYILAYSFPYFFTAVMIRYPTPLSTLTVILLGRILWLLPGRRAFQTAGK
jgi:hypothetical protein